MVQLAAVTQQLGACAEEAGQALQRHVLEGAGGTVPQLQDVGVFVQGGYGGDLVGVPLVAVSACHEGFHQLGGHDHVEEPVDGSGALGVGELCQVADLLQAQGGHVLGNVQSAALGKAVDDRLGEGHRLGDVAAGVDVKVFSHE